MEYLYLDRTTFEFNDEKKEVVIKLNDELVHAKRDESGNLYHKLDLVDVNNNKAEMIISVKQKEEDKIDFKKINIIDGDISYNEFDIFFETPYFKKSFFEDLGEKSCKFYKEFYNMDIDSVYQFNIFKDDDELEIKKFVRMVHEFKNKILEHPKITTCCAMDRYKAKILEKKPVFIKTKDTLVIKEHEKTNEIEGSYKILLKPIIRTIPFVNNKVVDNVIFLICRINEREFKNPFEGYLFDDVE